MRNGKIERDTSEPKKPLEFPKHPNTEKEQCKGIERSNLDVGSRM